MRWLLLAAVAAMTGCASYITPGGPVRLGDVNRHDIAEVAARRPVATFPARIAIVRVQAPDYRSRSAQAFASGRFSVMTAQELLSEDDQRAMHAWPSVAGLAPINRLLLPEKLDTLDDLRLAAAGVQADVLMVYTVDTAFRVQGRGYGPLAAISLGLVPDRDAFVTSTASALLVDVRSGFVYGVAEGTAKASGLTNAWSSGDTVDRKRLEAEREAFARLLTESRRTWTGVALQYTGLLAVPDPY